MVRDRDAARNLAGPAAPLTACKTAKSAAPTSRSLMEPGMPGLTAI